MSNSSPLSDQNGWKSPLTMPFYTISIHVISFLYSLKHLKMYHGNPQARYSSEIMYLKKGEFREFSYLWGENGTVYPVHYHTLKEMKADHLPHKTSVHNFYFR